MSAPKLSPRSCNEGPALSVVMPTLRRPEHLVAGIRSLLDGKWQDFELLVRDDGDGHDGTKEAVAAIGDPRIKYHWNATRFGMPGNINSGITETRGECVAVCHDHDLYKPSFLQSMLDTLKRNPSALFVHSAIEAIDQGGRHVATHAGGWPELSPGSSWLQTMLGSLHCPVCAITVVRRRAHEEYGLYDPEYGFVSDVEMWMRLSTVGDVAYVATPEIQVREREEGHEANANAESLRAAIARIHRRYGRDFLPLRKRVTHRLRLESQLLQQRFRERVRRYMKLLAVAKRNAG